MSSKYHQDWQRGDEPATTAQITYINRLSEETGTEPDIADLTKNEADALIKNLKARTGRA